MGDMVQIRSVKQYINDFIVKGLKDIDKPSEIDIIRIKQQMLDAFRREIFGQIAFKIGREAATMTRDDLAKIDTVNNILKQSVRKWKRICIICSEHGMGNIFGLEDLRTVLEEEEESSKAPDAVILPEDKGEDVTELTDGSEVYFDPATGNTFESSRKRTGGAENVI